MNATTRALTPQLRDGAMRWIADDPNPADRAELQRVLAGAMGGSADDLEALAERMSSPLTFGTAGIRGPLRAGPAGMNQAVVRRAAAGLGDYLNDQGLRGEIIVGFDGRHRSAEFALDIAKILAAKGFLVLLSPDPLPTPVTAFAVRQRGCVAGVQVTASHNPPMDNGMKVYLTGGTQLVGPADEQIERAIAATRPAVSIDVSGVPAPWPPDLLDDYLGRAAAQAGGLAKKLRIALTPMHGVGGESAVKALYLAGFTDVHVVPEQAAIDPEFPTVAFPNPEEPGATDLLLALAASVGADLAIALDPDADRCALGISEAGGWRMLNGNETGCLLGEHVLAGLDRNVHPDPLVATTIVSSQLLKRIAASHLARFDETLTGFKWIVRAGDGFGSGLVFGYEEALGVCVDPDVVRDKDGISAAVRAADLAAGLGSSGRTLADALDDLARAHGLHSSAALSVRVKDPSEIAATMTRLRADPPSTLLGETVTEVADLRPRTDALRLRTGRARVIFRPSGTEPKLKCYVELVTELPADAEDLAAVKVAAADDLSSLQAEVSQLIGME